MQMKSYKIIFFLCVGVLFFAPLLQMQFKLFPAIKLSGVENKVAFPLYSWGNYTSGKFQHDFESWLNQNYGLKEYFVKTNNQLYFWLFHEAPHGSQVFVGNHGQLIEAGYISGYYAGPLPQNVLEPMVQNIRFVQDKVEERGKIFLLIITPSKVALYPEYIIDGWRYRDTEGNRNYTALLPLLDKYGVKYIDGHKILADKKIAAPAISLFPKGATHWNYLGAYYVVDEMLAKIKQMSGENFAELRMERVDEDRNFIHFADKDMAELMNVWFPPLNYTVPRPVLSYAKAAQTFYPSIFMEGGSFSEQMINTMCSANIFQRMDFYFYYHDHVLFQGGKLGGERLGEIAKLDWENDVLKDHDIILVEVNEQAIPRHQKGFFNDAAKYITTKK